MNAHPAQPTSFSCVCIFSVYLLLLDDAKHERVQENGIQTSMTSIKLTSFSYLLTNHIGTYLHHGNKCGSRTESIFPHSIFFFSPLKK